MASSGGEDHENINRRKRRKRTCDCSKRCEKSKGRENLLCTGKRRNCRVARIALNWPQAVLRLEYVEDGQENVTMEEANEGEQE